MYVVMGLGDKLRWNIDIFIIPGPIIKIDYPELKGHARDYYDLTQVSPLRRSSANP